MQNLKEGQKVVVGGNPATIVSIDESKGTVVILTEHGLTLNVLPEHVSPQSFLTEIENDGKDIL